MTLHSKVADHKSVKLLLCTTMNQRLPRLVFVLVLVCSALGATTLPESTSFSCEGGNFTVGQNASVTCNLGKEDIDRISQLFIIHHPSNASDSFHGKTVLVCFLKFFGRTSCTALKNHSYDINGFTPNFTLKIPYVTAEFAGTYSCQLGLPDGKPKNVCSLHVTDKNESTTPRLQESTSTQPKVLTSTQNEESTSTQNKESTKLFFLIPGGVLLVLLVLLGIWLYRRNRRSRQQMRDDQYPLTSEEVNGC